MYFFLFGIVELLRLYINPHLFVVYSTKNHLPIIMPQISMNMARICVLKMSLSLLRTFFFLLSLRLDYRHWAFCKKDIGRIQDLSGEYHLLIFLVTFLLYYLFNRMTEPTPLDIYLSETRY